MTATSENKWAFSIEGLAEIQIELKTAHLRVYRGETPEIVVGVADGEEIGDWLQVEHSGRVLSITQKGPRGHHAHHHHHGVEHEVHEAVHSALDSAFGVFDTVMEGLDATFGEGFFGTPGARREAPEGVKFEWRTSGHSQLTVAVAIPAALEVPRVSARLDRGDAAVEDLWGTLVLRTGMGAIKLTRCGRECTVNTGRGSVALADCSGHLTVHSGLGDLRLTGCEGSAEAHTGKGSVRLERCRLGGSCQTGHGDLWLESVSGGPGDVSAREGRRGGAAGRYHTGAGTVTLVRPQGGDFEAHSGMGDVVVQGGSVDALRAHSGAGNVRCTGLQRAGKLELHSGMGNIGVQGGAVGSLRMKCGAGNLECATTFGPGEHDLDTGAGNIEVRLPDNAGVRIDAVTRMGTVHSDFELVKVGRPGPVTIGSGRFVGSIGSGEATATLHMKTGAGNIAIRRALEPWTAGDGPGAASESQGEAERPSVASSVEAERTRLAVLHSLQRGEITVEEAMALLDRVG